MQGWVLRARVPAGEGDSQRPHRSQSPCGSGRRRMLVSPRGSAQSRRLGRQPARNGSQTPSHGADGTGVSAGVTAGQVQARGRGEQPQTPRTGLHWGGRLAQKEDIQKEDLFIFWTSQEMRRISRPAWRESRRDGLVPLHGPQPLRDDAGWTVPLLNQAWPALHLGVHPGAEGGSRPKAEKRHHTQALL